MFEYTKDNHLRLENNDGVFEVTVGGCSRLPHSFFQECISAAKEIASRTDEIIYVNYTHDLTSQVMCFAFAEAGVKFTAVNTLMGSYNLFQSSMAKQFFQDNKMRYTTIELNLRDYFTKFLPETNLENNKASINAYIQTQLDGLFVSTDMMHVLDRKPSGSVGFVSLRKNKFYDALEYDECSIEVKENCLFNYYKQNDIKCIPEFFFYTPELMSAFYEDPDIVHFVKSADHITTTKYASVFTELILPLLYTKSVHNLQPIPLYDGIQLIDINSSFDKISKYYSQHNQEHKTNLVRIPYNELVKYIRIMDCSKTWKSSESDDFLTKFLKND